MRPTRNDVLYKRERLARIIVQHRNGNTSVGTGFFINKQGNLLTCFHVISGMELSNLRMINSNITGSVDEEHFQLQNYLNQSVINIEIEFMDGTRNRAAVVNFNQFYDVAMLKIDKLDSSTEIPFFDIDTDYTPEYDESTFFCGFQLTGGYTNPTQYPFSINRAVVSAFPEVVVAGDRYQHIQLNSINLGGNSGAPLFVEGSNKVIGIVNGNMSWGGNNLVVVNNGVQNTPINPPKLQQASLQVPLCIAYVTSLKLVKEEANIL
jgi:S1-C subfamily serine protease